MAFTEHETWQLKNAIGVLSVNEIVQLMGKSRSSVYEKIKEIKMNVKHRASWDTCRNSNCIHPNNGQLTKSDYYKNPRCNDGYQYECKKCYSAYMNKYQQQKRDYTTCRNKDCVNERQGKLTIDDFKQLKKYNKLGERLRLHTCKACLAAEQWHRRNAISGPGKCKNLGCANPKNGKLTKQDYSRSPNGALSKTCKHCRARMDKQLDFELIANQSLVQQWLCGRIGHANTTEMG